jgi:hypothetical protein
MVEALPWLRHVVDQTFARFATRRCDSLQERTSGAGDDERIDGVMPVIEPVLANRRGLAVTREVVRGQKFTQSPFAAKHGGQAAGDRPHAAWIADERQVFTRGAGYVSRIDEVACQKIVCLVELILQFDWHAEAVEPLRLRHGICAESPSFVLG